MSHNKRESLAGKGLEQRFVFVLQIKETPGNYNTVYNGNRQQALPAIWRVGSSYDTHGWHGLTDIFLNGGRFNRSTLSLWQFCHEMTLFLEYLGHTSVHRAIQSFSSLSIFRGRYVELFQRGELHTVLVLPLFQKSSDK